MSAGCGHRRADPGFAGQCAFDAPCDARFVGAGRLFLPDFPPGPAAQPHGPFGRSPFCRGHDQPVLLCRAVGPREVRRPVAACDALHCIAHRLYGRAADHDRAADAAVRFRDVRGMDRAYARFTVLPIRTTACSKSPARSSIRVLMPDLSLSPVSAVSPVSPVGNLLQPAYSVRGPGSADSVRPS